MRGLLLRAYLALGFSIQLAMAFRVRERSQQLEVTRAAEVSCGQAPNWANNSSQRVAILLRGETFRYNATENQSASWRELKDNDIPDLQGEFADSHQMVATESQKEKLIKPLEDAGFQVDVFSATYKSAWHKQHMDVFGNRLKADVIGRRSGSTQASNLLEGLDAVANYAKAQKIWYKDVYILRHDLFLKQDLLALAKDKPNKILFAFKAFTKPNHHPDGSEYVPKNHVSDMMIFTPGQFFGCLNDVVVEHRDNIWNSDLNKNHQEIWDALSPKVGGNDHLGTLIDGEYWCNPRKYAPDEDAATIANPIYDISGRERCDHGHVGSKLPGGKAPEVGLDHSSTKLYILIGFILTVLGVCWAIFGSGGKMYSLLICFMYPIFSTAITVSISLQKAKKGNYDLDPMCAVCLVEFTKLLASSGLHCYNSWSSSSSIVPVSLSFEDAKWLLLPSLGYTFHNLLAWYAIGANDLATFGIFRESLVFWTAAIWFLTFWEPLGKLRLIGLFTIFVGIVLSEVSKATEGFSFQWAALLVLLMTLVNAVSAVLNEKAVKRNFALDLNVQNSILYSMMTVISLFLIACAKPSKIVSPAEFFDGFSGYTVLTICLQTCAGLLVSRLLKYADSTMKTVAACLRGPSLVLLTTAPPLTITSAVIIMAGSMTYLFQGPLKVNVEASPPQKSEAENSASFSASFVIKKGSSMAEGTLEASVEETKVQA